MLVGYIINTAAEEIEVFDEASLGNAILLVGETSDLNNELLSIHIRSGDYKLSGSFHIARSNVHITTASGARFVLEDNVNAPVVAIGSQEQVIGDAHGISNVSITGLLIDGNRENQSSEYMSDKPWIRNNGIDVRGVENLTITQVEVVNCRSGGLVLSWNTSKVTVRKSKFSNHEFDGVAYYDCRDIYTINCEMSGNRSAGVSLDNAVRNSTFTGCLLESNGDVGVFMRNSEGILFNQCVIQESGQWAVFLGHDKNEHGVKSITFAECRFVENNGGIHHSSVNDVQSSGTYILHSGFLGNETGGRLNVGSLGSSIVQSNNYEISKSKFLVKTDS